MNAGTLDLGTTARFAVEDLSIGMFVSSLDIPATQAPFPLQGFYIATKDDLMKISYYCKWVIVNITRSRTADSLEPTFTLEKRFGKESSHKLKADDLGDGCMHTGQKFQGSNNFQSSNNYRSDRCFQTANGLLTNKSSSRSRINCSPARSKKMKNAFRVKNQKNNAAINTPKNNPFRALMVLLLLSAGFFMIR